MPNRSSDPRVEKAGAPFRVLVAQPLAEGHYLVLYVRHLFAEARRRGWETDLLTTEQATRSSAYRLIEAEAAGTLGTFRMPPVVPPPPTFVRLMAHQVEVCRAFRRGFADYRRERSANVVFVPDLDRFSKVLPLLGSPFGDMPFSGMLIAARHHHRRAGLAAAGARNDAAWEWLFRRMLAMRTLRRVGTTDPLLVRDVAARAHPGHRKLCYVPEPGSVEAGDRELARKSLGLGPDQVAVLAYGSLEPRKGVAELVTALSAPEADPRLVLVVAGKETPEVTALLAGPDSTKLVARGRLVRRSGFIDPAAEGELFAAADVVWLGYTGFDLGSGVMIQTGAAARPLIACGRGLIGYRAQRHELGPVVDPARTAEVVGALNQLARDPAVRGRYAANASAYAARHTPERFARVLCDMIQAAADASSVGK